LKALADAGGYNRSVNRDDLRRFAERDWAAVADARLDYWAEQYQSRGAEAARRASSLLLEHVRRVQPGFPSDACRADDLAHHIAVRDLLDRAGRALTGR